MTACDEQTRNPASVEVRKHGSPYWYIALAMIVLVATALRLPGITQVGIRFDDEGAYVGDARLWHRCARVLVDGEAIHAAWHGDKSTLRRRMDDIGVDFASQYTKPSEGFTFLGAAMMFVVGNRPAALLVLSALLGTATVILVYALGAMLFDRSIGLLAAMVLAVSPFHVGYSRTAWTEATTIFFVCLALYLWTAGLRAGRSKWRTFGVAGLVLGYATTCHYRAGYVLGAILLTDIFARLDSLRNKPRALTCAESPEEHEVHGRSALGEWFRCWAWLGVGFVLPILCIEAGFQAIRLVAHLSDSYVPIKTYFESAWEWKSLVAADLARVRQDTWTAWFSVGRTYLEYFVHFHGWLPLGLVAIGVVTSLRSRGAGRLVSIFILLTAVILQTQPLTVARSASMVFPVLCLAVALGLRQTDDWLRLRGTWRLAGGVAVCTLMFWPMLTIAMETAGRRSQIADLCAWVANRHEGDVVVSGDSYYLSKYWLYLDGTGTKTINRKFHREGRPSEVLQELREEGVRWVVIDPQPWHYRWTPPGPSNVVFEWWREAENYLKKHAVTVKIFPHIQDHCWNFLSESPGLAHLDEMVRQRAGRLRLYELPERDTLATGQPYFPQTGR